MSNYDYFDFLSEFKCSFFIISEQNALLREQCVLSTVILATNRHDGYLRHCTCFAVRNISTLSDSWPSAAGKMYVSFLWVTETLTLDYVREDTFISDRVDKTLSLALWTIIAGEQLRSYLLMIIEVKQSMNIAYRMPKGVINSSLSSIQIVLVVRCQMRYVVHNRLFQCCGVAIHESSR